MDITEILCWATLVLAFSGLLFSAIFLRLHMRHGTSDLNSRAESALRIVKITMILPIVFAFLSALMVNSELVSAALSRASFLYFVMSVIWLIGLLICGVVMLITLLSVRFSDATVSAAVKRLFRLILPCALVCMVLSWLFS